MLIQRYRYLIYAFFIGVLLATLTWRVLSHFTHNQQQIQRLQKQHTLVIAIDHLPIYQHRRLQLLVHINQPIHALLELNWYGHHPKIKLGQQWRCQTKWPNIAASYQHSLWGRGILARGYIVKCSQQQQSIPLSRLYQLRVHLAFWLWHHVANPDLAAILIALTVGIRAFLTRNIWHIFQQTGTSHLVAISGLHVGLVALLGYYLGSLLWRCHHRLCLILPAQYFGRLFSLGFASCYALLAGGSIPTERALIMLCAAILISFSNYRLSFWWLWLLALFSIIAWQPLSILSASFWLSFMAVGSLLWMMQGRHDKRYGYNMLLLQLGLILALSSGNIAFFGKLSLVSTLANFVAIPAVSLAILPCTLLAIILLSINQNIAILTLKISAIILQGLWQYLSFLAKAPMWVYANTLNKNDLWIWSLAILWLLLPRAHRLWGLGLVIAAYCCWIILG